MSWQGNYYYPSIDAMVEHAAFEYIDILFNGVERDSIQISDSECRTRGDAREFARNCFRDMREDYCDDPDFFDSDYLKCMLNELKAVCEDIERLNF